MNEKLTSVRRSILNILADLNIRDDSRMRDMLTEAYDALIPGVSFQTVKMIRSTVMDGADAAHLFNRDSLASKLGYVCRKLNKIAHSA